MNTVEQTKYWVWLTNLPNITPDKITALLEHFGSITEIYAADPDAYRDVYGIGKREIMSLSYKDLSNAEKIIDRTLTAGARIISFDSPEYPPMLRQISAPPYVLYAKGNTLNWEELFLLGVVGTRLCDERGVEVANSFCHDLARAGVTIVSGMARGIDSLAAKAALRAGAKTVAVLGSGIDIVYPPENKRLMDEIIKNGVVLTEYPPLSKALRHHFPERNRIINGLSRGILVIEAPGRSGSLITAAYAKNSGKDIFSVPGYMADEAWVGSNRLIQRGAKLVLSAADILEEYPDAGLFLPQTDTQPAKKPTPADIQKSSQYQNLRPEEQRIAMLLAEKPLHIDELVRKTNLSVSALNPMLAMMEVMGCIRKQPGNYYKLNL